MERSTRARSDGPSVARPEGVDPLILDTLAEGVIACDRSGRIVTLNPAMIEIIFNAEDAEAWRALEPETVEPRTLAKYFRVTDLDRAPLPVERLPLARALAGERFRDLELYLQPRGERPKRIRVSGSPLLDAEGRKIGAVNVTQDVSLAHERAREAALAQAMLDSTADCAFRAEPDTLAFRYANRAMLELLGLDARELVRRGLLDFVPDADRGDLRAGLDSLRSGARSIEIRPFSLIAPDGGLVPVEASLQLMPAAAGEVCVVGVLRDVSERERRQRQTVATQRLEAIGSLASGIAHDLNNVLTPILLALPMLRDAPENADALLESIEASAERGTEMIRSLLVFTRGETDTGASCNVGRVVEEMHRIIRTTFPKNIEIVLDAAESLPDVAANDTRLHQALLNLCLNARDSMAGGGRLTIQTRAVEISAARDCTVGAAAPGRYVELSVEDTGSGIERRHLDAIFDAFFTTRDSGTGIGLATVREVVEQSEGYLEVDSTPGAGTCFRAGFRAIESAVATDRSAEIVPNSRQARGRKILVVDDEAMIRTMVESLLGKQGFEVLTAVDGRDALDVLRREGDEISIMLTDTSMPGMGGLELAAHLAEEYPTLPVIVCSGNIDDAQRSAFEAHGVRSFLAKPFRRNDLLEAIEDASGPRT